MATQKDVAERAGVSFITVSRVINGLNNVAPETRTRVEAAIRELKYHPNRQAQALNHGLTHTLAFVTPRMYDLALYNNFFVMSLLSGMELKGRELGWDILLTTDYDQGADFDFLRVWHQRKVDGLAFVGFQRFPAEQRLAIEEEGIPCVSISDRIDSPAISWIDGDNAKAAKDAVERLYSLGHRSFAFLGVDPERDYNPNIRERERAVRLALKKKGLSPLSLVSSAPSSGESAAREYRELKSRPGAVIAGNDSTAISFIEDNARHGLECPRDYSIVGFDAEPAAQARSPTVASYAQPLLEMGSFAVDVLAALITDRKLQKQTRVFPLSFVGGESLGSVP
jgi:DNA-binding LacI/PurR family transcriptional regulator